MEKNSPRSSRNSPRSSRNSRLFQRLILGDRQGTCMHATIFGADIEQDSLEPYKTYRISNAPVRFIDPAYRVVKNDFQITVNGATLVEKVEDTEEEPIRTNFTSFADQHSKAHNTLVDIVAAAVQINEPHQIKSLAGELFVQELLLVTEDLNPTFFSLWDHFIEREGCDITSIINTWPIIVGTRIRTTTSNGPALSTKSASCLMINPYIPEKQKLHLWCSEHKEKIEVIILATQGLTRPPTSTLNATNVLTAHAAKTNETMEPYWIRATTSITNLEQKFWYVSCSNCHKAIHVHCGRSYSCVYCKQSVTAQARCRFDVELNDDTGTIRTNCFRNHAKKLFYFTAEDLKDNTDENGVTDKQFIENHLSKNIRLFLLKPYNLQLPYKTERRLTILVIEDDSEEASSSAT